MPTGSQPLRIPVLLSFAFAAALLMAPPAALAGLCDCVTEGSGFSGGDGSEANPYQVCLPAHLDNVRNHLSSNYLQTDDIDMTGFAFSPIGDDTNHFEGVYDGGHFTISNLLISQPTFNNMGLFGVLGSTGTIKSIQLNSFSIEGQNFVASLLGQNFGLIDMINEVSSTLLGSTQVGGLVGNNRPGGSILNSSSNSSVDTNGSGNSMGGITGTNEGSVSNSKAMGTVDGAQKVGGIAGSNDGSVSSSFSRATVFAPQLAGGVVGIQNSGASTSNSYNEGNISGGSFIGGLIGGLASSIVTNSYSSGGVTGTGSNIGGLIGIESSGTVNDSFWDTESSGQASSAGGVGKTTAEMMMQSTFDPPWDFTSVWTIDEGNDYPRLIPPPPPPLCVCADLNRSGGPINLNDFARFALCFNVSPLTCPNCACADLNGDGGINLVDFATFSLLFNTVSSDAPPNCS